MAALSTCINGFKCMMMLPGACYFTKWPLKESQGQFHFTAPLDYTTMVIMSESPLLTSAKNNPLARKGRRPLDGGHGNTCLLALATAHCLASSRLGWTHHSPDLLGGGGIVLS